MVSPLKNKLDLDAPVRRGKSWLDAGTHEGVTILDVDPLYANTSGVLKFTFEKEKRTHRETIYLMDRQKRGLSWKLAAVIGAVFPGPEIKDYYQWLTEDDWEDALQALRGMMLTITLEQGPGYTIELNQDTQLFQAIQGGEVLCESEQISNLERICKARSLTKSYRTVKDAAAGEDHVVQRNLLALRSALASRQTGEARKQDSLAAKNARFVRATTRK